MKPADSLVKLLMMGFLKASAFFYGVKINGLDKIVEGEGAAIGVKHANSVDLPLMVYALGGKATILASSHIFKNPVSNYLLRVAGAIPLYTAPEYRTLRLNGDDSHKRMLSKILDSDGWIAYAPEGNVAKDTVLEEVYPEILMKAAKSGKKTYLVGIKFRNKYHPWFSFLRLPWQNGIEVNIENYDAREKARGLVCKEIKDTFARLSGLERKIFVSPA